ncbi:MAG TPA: hypothetical protein VGR82_04385 [Methylomirabilota bacterium]|nr:hypothetical protein [Methylomirabilota bacterium]
MHRQTAMVIVQAVIAFLTRSAGKLLNTAFAWATVLLFGRVSEKRQIYVSAVAFGSVLWLVVLVGVAFPFIATFLLSFVKPPEWVDKKWIRLAMLGAVALIPLVVGVISILMLDRAQRPRGVAGILSAILKGYPYTVGLAVTLVMMTVFAPILRTRTLFKRWTAEHVPVIVTPEDYAEIVAAVQEALAAGGLPTTPRRAPWTLRAPTKILTMFARGAVADLVAEQMTMLASPTLEVILHPSDLVISGRQGTAARARAIIARRLVFTPAYMTWDKEANEIEDRLIDLWQARDSRAPDDLRRALDAVAHDLDRLEIAYEEWEVLFRAYLLVERSFYREDRTEVKAAAA